MKEEKSLSEKFFIAYREGNAYWEDDVKEFIKRLKEETNPDKNSVLSKQDWIWVMLQIDKLAGDKLK